MVCPHLAYRREAGEKAFDHKRAYCTVMAAFCSPMRADICNDRFEFDHEAHCEVFQKHAAGEYDDGETTRAREVASVRRHSSERD
ncbi:Uncharacterized protein HSBGL_0898 [Halapricum desulfuricans]|uniref:Uncharacterized protein n=1 Tax=Halapricum desulfuricans TaxID=2841257 RepID=A0A897NFI8_9EURY|nr:hypothetical protein [Halapricum desulfuricans]QSG11328.1 Uncharacterized protein HSBGL_0898 [Halapricum desulfuricans]